jgi:DNA-directed RNA polymerase specialized sigma24 family protein
MSQPLYRQVRWQLTQEAFDRLLASLDADRDSAGERYVKIRSKLISYFECRDCPFPEDHADETINRVARKLESGEEIRDPASYVYGVARLLLLEILKERGKHQSAIEQLSRSQPDPIDDDDDPRVECFNNCLARLDPEDRHLITQYYNGERRAKIENRNRIAESLEISQTALRLRAHRLRVKLEKCVNKCVRQVAEKM